MSKILKLIKIILRAKIIWKKPKRKNILIYDYEGSNKLTQYFKPESFHILHVRKEELNFSILMKKFFLLLIKKDFNIYIDQYINEVRPKLIITFIDNDYNFYSLKSRHPSIETFMIQNGTRSYYGDIFEKLDKLDRKNLDKFKLDTFLAFGKNIGEHFKHYISIKKVISIGSILNNSIKINSAKTVKDRILFISQYVDPQMYDPGCEKKIILFLNSYCIKKNKKFNILLRSKKDELEYRLKEINFYKKVLQNKVNFLERDISMNSYNICDSSELVVGVDSTLCYESLARKQKTAIFSIRGNATGVMGYNFCWPGNFSDVGPFWCNIYDEKIFTNILDNLIEMSEADWQSLLISNNIDKYITYDEHNSILLDKIKSFQ